MPASGSALSLESALRDRAWRQWVALGVDAVVERDDAVVDLEALIALTAELGDADARLLDVSTDWCVAHGRYVNGARLRQVVRELGTPAEAIGGFVATVAGAGGPTWPMGTKPRPGYVDRGKARLESADSPARLNVRLRAAFGVHARADVLSALVNTYPAASSVADLARRTRFTKPNVASAVDALVLAGLVATRPVGNERRVSLATKGAVLPGLRPPVPQPDWVARFRVALEALRFARRDGMSSTVRAIEARKVVDGLLDPIAAEGMPRLNLSALGEDFAPAFDRWTSELGFWLRLPARG